ncbi:hypothetical protein V0288_12100 [Pannus brasiliensis CCIBt3594]|uniref:Uncharacterized protein n=1 Tax=Pannus brasiliensis CCIBt3594 TaxID=1427578 RepID=A0AAW9QRL2_9CHRO
MPWQAKKTLAFRVGRTLLNSASATLETSFHGGGERGVDRPYKNPALEGQPNL